MIKGKEAVRLVDDAVYKAPLIVRSITIFGDGKFEMRGVIPNWLTDVAIAKFNNRELNISYDLHQPPRVMNVSLLPSNDNLMC